MRPLGLKLRQQMMNTPLCLGAYVRTCPSVSGTFSPSDSWQAHILNSLPEGTQLDTMLCGQYSVHAPSREYQAGMHRNSGLTECCGRATHFCRVSLTTSWKGIAREAEVLSMRFNGLPMWSILHTDRYLSCSHTASRGNTSNARHTIMILIC